MNKKQYIFPSLTVVEIDADSLMAGSTQGNGGNGLDTTPGESPDPAEGEDMEAAMRGGFFDWN